MAGYKDFDFDFDATQQGAWGEFTTRLDEVLSVMDSTADLTISVASPIKGDEVPAERPGIRFSVTAPGRITAYVKGDEGGEPTPAQAEALHRLAWDQPHATEHRFHTIVDQEDSGPLAQLATETLTEVFGVLHPIFLEPDQLAEILQGTTDWVPLTPKPLKKGQESVMPANRIDLARQHRSRRNPGGVLVQQQQLRGLQREAIRKPARGHQQRQSGIGGHQAQPVGGIGRVERHVGGAQLQDRQQGRDQLRVAFKAHTDQIALADASRRQGVRKPAGARVELAVGQRVGTKAQGDPLR